MDTLLEKNIEILKKNNIYYKIKEEDDSDYEIIQCLNKKKSLKIHQNNKIIHLHSAYDPELESKLFVNSISIEKEKLIILFGSGLFYHVKEILKKFDKSVKILLIEPDYNIFNQAIKNINLEEIFKNDNVFIYIELVNNETFTEFLSGFINWVNVSSFNILLMPGYIELYKNTIEEMIKNIQDVYRFYQLSQNTVLKYSKQWGINAIKNIDEIFNSYNLNDLALELSKIKNLPAIVVSAGPSLNENVEELKKVQDKAVIICVYTAYNVLFENGIIPDIVFSVESNQMIYETEEQKAKKLNFTIAYDVNVENEFLNKNDGDKYLFFTDKDNFYANLIESLDNKFLSLSTGGSVSTTALSFAYEIGANPIILLGQDLSYTENQTHAKGTFYDNFINHRETISNLLFYVDGNKQRVLTDPSFNVFKIWIENYIKGFENIEVINAIDGGAKINGTINMSLEKASSIYLKNNIKSYKIDAFKNTKTKGKIFDDNTKKSSIELLNNNLTNYTKITKILRESIDLCYTILILLRNQTYNKNKIKTILRKLDYNDSLIIDLKGKNEFFKYVFQNTAFETIESNFSNDIEAIKNNLNFYENIKEDLTEPLALLKEKLKIL